MFNGFVIAGGGGDGGRGVWVAKLLLLCRCFVKVDTGSMELPFMKHMQFIPYLDGEEAELCSVCLRLARTDAGEDESVVSTGLKETDCAVAENGLEQILFRVFSALCMWLRQMLLGIPLPQTCSGLVIVSTLIVFSGNLKREESECKTNNNCIGWWCDL